MATSSPYVSRGALKLLPALAKFGLDLTGMTALDVGAATGGFSDLLLRRGARRVYAVDVGRGLLHGRLRADPRVVCLEGVNARYLSRVQVPEAIDVLVADVSFISLRRVLPPAAVLLRPEAWVMVLVKPQFEAARHEVPSGGIVASAAVRARVVREMRMFVAAELGWRPLGVVAPPPGGKRKNREYVLVCRTPGRPGECGAGEGGRV